MLAPSWKSVLQSLILGGALLICGLGDEALAQKSVLDVVKERGFLRAGIRIDNPPHSFVAPDGRWQGFDVEIAEAIAEELGVTLEKVKVDELTRISFLQNGQIDIAAASISHTKKRDGQIDFSQTYFWSKQTFLVKQGEVKTLNDLIGKRVGVSRGSHAIGNWRDWLAGKGHQLDPSFVVEFGNKQAGVEAVRQGAIAGYAEDYEVLASFAKNAPSLTVLDGEAIGMKQDGIGVRENDSRMRDAINFALQQIARSGKYNRIYNTWFGPDTATPMPEAGEIEIWPNG